MTIEPYGGAKQVFWIVDNGSSHRGNAPSKRFPNAVMVHTRYATPLAQPRSKSGFSIIQRKIVSPSDFTNSPDRPAKYATDAGSGCDASLAAA